MSTVPVQVGPSSPNLSLSAVAWSWTARILVAAVFLAAAYGKIQDPIRFAEQIQDYRLVPIAWTHAMAFIVPWVELLTIALLLTGFWRREARALIAAQLIVFTAAKG